VAVAAAVADNLGQQGIDHREGSLLAAAAECTPEGRTQEGLRVALGLPAGVGPERAGRILGNGSQVVAYDTVPFALWVADRFLPDFPAALWAVIRAGGDVDTVGAIVGGVVAVHAAATIPQMWLAAREPLERGEGFAPAS
jgi:ADP-ribosylglycohydrolase